MIQITAGPRRTGNRQFVFFTARRLEGFGPNYYQWVPTAKVIEEPCWFIRDTSNSWYHTQNRPAMSLVLRHIVRTFRGRTIFVGSSMGGYGAILMSRAARPDRVIAFSPNSPRTSIAHTLDGYPPIDIHVCKESKWNKVNGRDDTENALDWQKYATITYHDCAIHNVAGALRETNKLHNILERA